MQLGLAPTIRISIHDICWYQKQHDHNFHRDISYLPLMKRMGHLNHHLTKYIGQIDSTREHLSEDFLATVISMAGALNMSLVNQLSSVFGKTIQYIDQITPLYNDGVVINQIKLLTAFMAKTIEGFDHLEAISYRQEMENTVTQLFILAVQLGYRSLKLGGANYNAVFKIDATVEDNLRENYPALSTLVFINYHRRLYNIRLKNHFYKYYIEGMSYSGRKASSWVNTHNQLSTVYQTLQPYFLNAMSIITSLYAVPVIEIDEL